MRRARQRLRGLGLGALGALSLSALLATPAWAEHGYALWGTLKYPAGFAHFDYANPQAPKGGEIRLVSNLRYSTFDKYNPFTMKGSPPAYLADLMFDSLLTAPLDESGSAYGLLAQDVRVAPDRLSATFTLNPQARFHNGDPVTAQDVLHSYAMLTSAQASPAYQTVFAEVAGVDALDARTVRFRFKAPNRDLPLTVGVGLPVFSHKWGAGKPFDQVVMDVPIGSGPYTVGPVKFGRDITYVRNPNYWARGLNVRVGMLNFDRVLVKIYKDSTARLEALKAGEFDLMRVNSAGDWARRMTGPKFKSGELLKGEFASQNPTGFQSFVLNTRKPLLQDPRVREALGLAIDFEWMSRRLFYGAYQRVSGIFGNTACQAKGLPDEAQLAVMAPWRAQLPPAAFGRAYQPPRTDGSANGLRDNLRRAQTLLAEAGWTVQGGVLKNAQGQPFVLEYLESSEAGIRTVSPWQRNLEKLGIALQFRVVDYALYQQRTSKYEYDVISINFPGVPNPGQELPYWFGSKSADTPDSGNLSGIQNRAVDALIAGVLGAQQQADYLANCRALDRAISHSHILLPQWYSGVARMAYNTQRLVPPQQRPPYLDGELWAIATWWAGQTK
jgi:microcin C transport system substrate-binding protein